MSSPMPSPMGSFAPREVEGFETSLK